MRLVPHNLIHRLTGVNLVDRPKDTPIEIHQLDTVQTLRSLCEHHGRLRLRLDIITKQIDIPGAQERSVLGIIKHFHSTAALLLSQAGFVLEELSEFVVDMDFPSRPSSGGIPAFHSTVSIKTRDGRFIEGEFDETIGLDRRHLTSLKRKESRHRDSGPR